MFLAPDRSSLNGSVVVGVGVVVLVGDQDQEIRKYRETQGRVCVFVWVCVVCVYVRACVFVCDWV